jgi:hypothetical protein
MYKKLKKLNSKLTPVILAIQKHRLGESQFKASQGKAFAKFYLEKKKSQK